MNRNLNTTIILLLVCANTLFAQTAKKYFSSAEKYLATKNYAEAITNYTQAIQMDPNYAKAFVGRAICHELTGKKADAAEDFKRATIFSPKDKELYYNAGRLYFDIEKNDFADPMFKKAIKRDKGYQEAIELRIKTLTKLKNFQEGLAVAELVLKIKKKTYH